MVKLHENLKQLEWKPTQLVRPFLPDRTSYYSKFSPLSAMSCSFLCFHRSLKPSCCFQEPQHCGSSHKCFQRRMQPQLITLGESFLSPKALLTCLLFLLFSGCLWSETGLFWSLLLFVVWNCGTDSVPYTCMISLLNSTLPLLKLLAIGVWKC